MSKIKGLIVILIFLSVQCVGMMKKSGQIPQKARTQNIADTLEYFNEMGKDSSLFLNNYEVEYFNLRFRPINFDFKDKKIVFSGPGGLVFSDKKNILESLQDTHLCKVIYISLMSPKKKRAGDMMQRLCIGVRERIQQTK